ncbi:hypothetical protein AB0A69_09925 [Streptomyces sp. NPDC045431]|uniref:hypothetical protein n=1 Tax=Streptomyces sp. NPDC045431 TaxID=3155613 RepID=UPI0033FA2346
MTNTTADTAGSTAGTTGTTDPADPFAPSTGAVRVFAGIGLLLLAVAFVATLVIVLNQAYSGDGGSGPLIGAAMWSMGLSGLVGLAALCAPRDTLDHAVRRGAVFAQYALAFGGPVLAAIDFA